MSLCAVRTSSRTDQRTQATGFSLQTLRRSDRELSAVILRAARPIAVAVAVPAAVIQFLKKVEKVRGHGLFGDVPVSRLQFFADGLDGAPG